MMYKKLLTICVITILSLSICYANTPMKLRLVVKPKIEISLDRSDVDFIDMRPGETKGNIPVQGIAVNTKSNTGNKWYLLINAQSELREGDKYIPNENFFWYGWSEGQGTWYGTNNDYLRLTPVTAYASTAAEGNSYPNGINNILKFKLSIPDNQQAGNYQTMIQFTVTE